MIGKWLMQFLGFKNRLGMNIFLIPAMLLVFTGCGGSGGGSEPDPIDPPIEPPTNVSPVAFAGDDQSVTASDSVSLTGSATDTDGTISSFSWRQTAGTSVQLDGADSANASFVAPSLVSDETLTFELLVTDDDSATDIDSINVLVVSQNQAPTLDLGDDQSVQEGLEYSVSATPEDSDGSITSFNWELLSISQRDIELRNISTARVTFVAPLIDQNEFVELQLVVTDDQGATATDTIRVEVINFIAKLNDTGVITCGDYATGGSNQHGNRENCLVLTDGENDPIPVGQDGHMGLDRIDGNDENGKAGFNFTKLDSNGNELLSSATEWHCVKDNNTGLIWEVKQALGGLHDATNTYSWLNTNESANGDDIGTANGGICAGSDCDTQGFVNAVNEVTLCGAGDWSVPSREQLRTLVDYGVFRPAITIDPAFFPNSALNHWTSTPEANRPIGAWIVSFFDGSDSGASKNSQRAVRLVRSAE